MECGTAAIRAEVVQRGLLRLPHDYNVAEEKIMTELEIAWLAGILEGEGYFCYQRGPSIRLSMTDRDIVERAGIIMGTHCHPMTPRPNRKQAFRANIHGPRSIAMMERILPYMGTRRGAKIREIMQQYANRPKKPYGEQCNDAKLTDAQADEIRQLYIPYARFSGHSSGSIAKKYGISVVALKYVVKTRRNADGTQPLRPP